MAHPGPPASEVVLTELERSTLERWSRRPTSAQALARRCRIVLACAEGKNNTAIAAELGLSRQTVRKWRNRFIVHGLEGLNDEPRRPRAEEHRRRCRRDGGRQDPRGAAGRRHALVDAVHGQGHRHEPVGYQPDLACVRAVASSRRDLRAVARSTW